MISLTVKITMLVTIIITLIMLTIIIIFISVRFLSIIFYNFIPKLLVIFKALCFLVLSYNALYVFLFICVSVCSLLLLSPVSACNLSLSCSQELQQIELMIIIIPHYALYCSYNIITLYPCKCISFAFSPLNY